ncbi:hypothetical protein [Burkholderia gladioli]|uniref:hypothetical protein n=1 Tax=Burkholderia gladioli TaxID=28095 RepID=UPI00163E527F|nr:hypothetical protein [Burkholderia gladioli]MDN7600373.1 hypothetical protein [Burkholderia gladioli]MDN7812376.1 hypothetical protein [Burkholderia gladioli]
MTRVQSKAARSSLDTTVDAARRAALNRLAMIVDRLDMSEANALTAMSDDELERLVRYDLARGSMLKAEQAAVGHEGHADENDVLRRREALVREQHLMKPATFLERLGVTKQALSKAVKSGRIFGVSVGPTTYYPAFYLSLEVDRKRLQKVTQELGSLPGWSKWQFFTQPKGSLGRRTPLEALEAGMVTDVMAAAKGFAER